MTAIEPTANRSAAPFGDAGQAGRDTPLPPPPHDVEDLHHHAHGECLHHRSKDSSVRHIKRILIEFIPQSEMRYPTTGDWYFENDTLHILATAMPDERHQQLVAFHEIAEALACNATGVTQEAVDAFDMGPGADLDEPGNDLSAPYHQQHLMATEVEMALAAAMGVDWAEYDAAVGDHGIKEP